MGVEEEKLGKGKGGGSEAPKLTRAQRRALRTDERKAEKFAVASDSDADKGEEVTQVAGEEDVDSLVSSLETATKQVKALTKEPETIAAATIHAETAATPKAPAAEAVPPEASSTPTSDTTATRGTPAEQPSTQAAPEAELPTARTEVIIRDGEKFNFKSADGKLHTGQFAKIENKFHIKYTDPSTGEFTGETGPNFTRTKAESLIGKSITPYNPAKILKPSAEVTSAAETPAKAQAAAPEAPAPIRAPAPKPTMSSPEAAPAKTLAHTEVKAEATTTTKTIEAEVASKPKAKKPKKKAKPKKAGGEPLTSVAGDKAVKKPAEEEKPAVTEVEPTPIDQFANKLFFNKTEDCYYQIGGANPVSVPGQDPILNVTKISATTFEPILRSSKVKISLKNLQKWLNKRKTIEERPSSELEEGKKRLSAKMSDANKQRMATAKKAAEEAAAQTAEEAKKLAIAEELRKKEGPIKEQQAALRGLYRDGKLREGYYFKIPKTLVNHPDEAIYVRIKPLEPPQETTAAPGTLTFTVQFANERGGSLPSGTATFEALFGSSDKRDYPDKLLSPLDIQALSIVKRPPSPSYEKENKELFDRVNIGDVVSYPRAGWDFKVTGKNEAQGTIACVAIHTNKNSAGQYQNSPIKLDQKDSGIITVDSLRRAIQKPATGEAFAKIISANDYKKPGATTGAPKRTEWNVDEKPLNAEIARLGFITGKYIIFPAGNYSKIVEVFPGGIGADGFIDETKPPYCDLIHYNADGGARAGDKPQRAPLWSIIRRIDDSNHRGDLKLSDRKPEKKIISSGGGKEILVNGKSVAEVIAEFAIAKGKVFHFENGNYGKIEQVRADIDPPFCLVTRFDKNDKQLEEHKQVTIKFIVDRLEHEEAEKKGGEPEKEGKGTTTSREGFRAAGDTGIEGAPGHEAHPETHPETPPAHPPHAEAPHGPTEKEIAEARKILGEAIPTIGVGVSKREIAQAVGSARKLESPKSGVRKWMEQNLPGWMTSVTFGLKDRLIPSWEGMRNFVFRTSMERRLQKRYNSFADQIEGQRATYAYHVEESNKRLAQLASINPKITELAGALEIMSAIGDAMKPEYAAKRQQLETLRVQHHELMSALTEHQEALDRYKTKIDVLSAEAKSVIGNVMPAYEKLLIPLQKKSAELKVMIDTLTGQRDALKKEMDEREAEIRKNTSALGESGLSNMINSISRSTRGQITSVDAQIAQLNRAKEAIDDRIAHIDKTEHSTGRLAEWKMNLEKLGNYQATMSESSSATIKPKQLINVLMTYTSSIHGGKKITPETFTKFLSDNNTGGRRYGNLTNGIPRKSWKDIATDFIQELIGGGEAERKKIKFDLLSIEQLLK